MTWPSLIETASVRRAYTYRHHLFAVILLKTAKKESPGTVAFVTVLVFCPHCLRQLEPHPCTSMKKVACARNAKKESNIPATHSYHPCIQTDTVIFAYAYCVHIISLKFSTLSVYHILDSTKLYTHILVHAEMHKWNDVVFNWRRTRSTIFSTDVERKSERARISGRPSVIKQKAERNKIIERIHPKQNDPCWA